MNDAFRQLAVRFLQSLGQSPDPEYFTEAEAWDALGELANAAAEGRQLDSMSVTILKDAGAALGIKPGAPEVLFLPALEEELGPCPFSAETVEGAVRYAREQINGQFESGSKEQKVALKVESKEPHVPLKNYEYK